MLILASIIADLTSFQIIGSTDALALVSTGNDGDEKVPEDKDEARVVEFMKLQSERREQGDLSARRNAVYQVAERLAAKLS
ncbi:hypothetical protein Q9L58_001239 [Maublancomyces gigas]|uniref:Uncharacterized protein n=1 Tax=Discina gigas TaxID=1032678 RepID=A0ABR3GVC7_9PEZI